MKSYDVVIVGAGHAGLEAAFACNKRNLKTALITLDENSIGLMPCNPSIGGPAKGIVTREIDCLGGIQAIASDANQLQMKLLNTSKGPGVWALRAQIDKVEYHKWFLKELKKTSIDLLLEEVISIHIKNNVVCAVETSKNKINTKYIIITTGTYLRSITHKGDDSQNEGPDGLKNANHLSKSLTNLGFKLIRLKTGTPARIKKDSIDYKGLQIESGTDHKLCFSHFNQKYLDIDKQLPCYIIHTNAKTHKIINDNLSKSAMYGGMISGIGPRYCPSIEDKVVKFSTKPRHQVFIEPESLSLDTMYLGGFSTSMPIDIQDAMIRTLPGMKNCIIEKYGYAIEYDAIDPTQLKKTLESKKIKNLYFAGQINGTSGYEEAAAQGLIAAINVANNYDGLEPLVLKRHESYIGVMIDDITTKGVTEPYRLLTSRAEYRLNLRNDNADERLLKIGYDNKMIEDKNYQLFLENQKLINDAITFLKSKTIGMYYKVLNCETSKTNQSLYDFIKRPEVKSCDVLKLTNYQNYKKFTDELFMKLDIKIKFEGYIKKQEEEISKIKNLSKIKLDSISDYSEVDNLSLEAIDKLNKHQPDDLDQASKISGINIADIINLKLYIDKRKK